MKKLKMAICMAAGTLLLAAPVFPEASNGQGQGHAVVTVLPKKGREAPSNVTTQDLRVKVDSKESSVTGWVPLRGSNDSLDLVVLIDGSARSSLGQQLGDIAQFIRSLPATTKVAVAYMQNGSAVLTAPLTTDHAQAAKGLHLTGGYSDASASPYFCLSDLAQHWPSNDPGARHEVLLITDGVDDYDRRYDPTDPYVVSAINNAVRAGLVVYSIYWRDQGHNQFAGDAGQNLLNEVTEATGGSNFSQGLGNPVSFQPFLEDLSWRLQNQYGLSFASTLKGKPVVSRMDLKVGGPAAKVYAPQEVFVGRAGGSGE
jgi:hypothetical protein